MSTLVKTFSELVTLFLSALRLAVVLPALVLVGLNVAFIGPQLEHTRLYAMLTGPQHELQGWIVLAVAVIGIAYMFSVLNMPIIRLFEGYSWMDSKWFLGPVLRKSNENRVQFLKRQLQDKEDAIRDIQWATQALSKADQKPSTKVLSELARKLDQVEIQRNLLQAELTIAFPHHQTWRILPTRLGNVIANAEEHPGHLFHIDAVTFWPYLAPILTRNGYATYVEREKAVFDFLLNMAVVSLIFGFELVYVDFLLNQFDAWQQMLAKIIISTSFAYLFYQASIQGAIGWGVTIKTAFTLHRETLREDLRMRAPRDFDDQRALWDMAGRFFRDGNHVVGKQVFDARISEDKQPRQDVPNTT